MSCIYRERGLQVIYSAQLYTIQLPKFNSQGHNLYRLKYISLEEVKECIFNNDFKVRLQKVTYLGYI